MGSGHVAIVGATASAKSALAMELARHDPRFEIVCVDSMQVYRHMDIGTAKPTAADRELVPHHCLDLVDPADEYSVAEFQRAALRAIDEIERRDKRALLVGGTGLYVRAVVDGLEIPGQFAEVRGQLEAIDDTAELHARLEQVDPVAAARMEPTNRRRVLRALEVSLGSGRRFSSYGAGLTAYGPTPFELVGIGVPRPVLDRRIAERYGQQLAAGFLREVRLLQERPEGLSRTAAQALGYKELLPCVAGVDPVTALDVDRPVVADALSVAITRTRQFARRQERWFRRDPRITWLACEQNPLEALDPLLEHCVGPRADMTRGFRIVIIGGRTWRSVR